MAGGRPVFLMDIASDGSPLGSIGWQRSPLLEEPEAVASSGSCSFHPANVCKNSTPPESADPCQHTLIDLLRDDGIGLDEVLLLQPGENGTSVRPAGELSEIGAYWKAGCLWPKWQ